MVVYRKDGVPAMRYASVRAVYLVIASAGVVFSAGCPGIIRQAAVDAIAAQIQPPNSAVVNKLESSGNPTGEGVIVFVRSQADCAPRYSWIWLNERNPSYALDKASQAITPGLQTLSEASQKTLKWVGSEAEPLAGQPLAGKIRDMLCHTAQSN